MPNKCVDLARFCSKCAFKVVISDFLASPSHSFCTFWQFLLFFRIIRIIREYSRIIVEIIRIFANNEKREKLPTLSATDLYFNHFKTWVKMYEWSRHFPSLVKVKVD